MHKQLLQLEKILLVSAFLFTLSIAVLQILLRNFFDSGIIWGDSFLRIAVLWIGMMGALYASRRNNHIHIDLTVKFLPADVLTVIKSMVHLFTSLICAFVTWYGIHLVVMEYEFSEPAFASIPVWSTMLIIPVVFSIMTIRYLLLSVKPFFKKTTPAKV
ncbi:MAG: TRAP transporter small permease [gamma proteobacterium symbiont of Taylorina sp.]|nr:TRAP transporter small permease [gamma proteobacterium symbiont of Taylorina sp.]